MPEDDKYDQLEKIGHGSFGVIRKVRRREDGLILCRKEISYSKMSQKEREQLQAELSILKELRHPNIVAYYERNHIKASQDLHLYMEFCGNGDLGKMIRGLKEKNQLAQEDLVWSIFAQIVSALYRCHYGENPPPPGHNVLGQGPNARPGRNNGRPMILHRDLKPENIFLGKDNSVKLGDFGLSKILQSHDFASTYVGTPFYMSPEICKAEQYTLHSDIWALGCIMYEMCAKEPPFNAKTHFELIQKIKAGKFDPIPSVYSPDLHRVIASCLQVYPNHRPETYQLLNLPAVKNMRKEQEVVLLGQELKDENERTARLNQDVVRLKQELERKLADLERQRKELESSLRREWEVKARLEIDRQVQLDTAHKTAYLEGIFETEVQARVEKILLERASRLSTSPKITPRSSTPTMLPVKEPVHEPLQQHADLFPAISQTVSREIVPTPQEPPRHTVVTGSSTSTVGADNSFASGTTDLTSLSSLSLDDSAEDTNKPLVTEPPKQRRPRAPLVRAVTMAPGHVAPSSPVDIQMAGMTPAPASLAPLSLSPRRTASRVNIFAAAKAKEINAAAAKRWEAEVPPSPTDQDWHADFDEPESPIHHLSPTTRLRSTSMTKNTSMNKTRSGSGSSNSESGGDPFKAIRTPHYALPTNRLASAPTLGTANPLTAKPRPASTVPIVAASPQRVRAKPSVLPSKQNSATKTSEPTGGMKSKKGNPDFRLQALRNNGGANNGVQGRTLVELQQARGIPMQALSEDEGAKRGVGKSLASGLRTPKKIAARSAGAGPGSVAAAVWDPETEEMPSPFIVRRRNFR